MTSKDSPRNNVAVYQLEAGQVFLTPFVKEPAVLPRSYEEAQSILERPDPQSLLLLDLEIHGGNYILNGNPPRVLGWNVRVKPLDVHLSRDYIDRHLPPSAIEDYRKGFSR